MTNKNLLFIGGGILILYFLSQQSQPNLQNLLTTQLQQNAQATAAITPSTIAAPNLVPEPIA